MYVALNYAGIRQHIALLEEERKKTGLLRESLELKIRQLSMEPGKNLNGYRRTLQKVERLEESIKWRIVFLDGIVDGFSAVNDSVQSQLEDMEIHLNRNLTKD